MKMNRKRLEQLFFDYVEDTREYTESDEMKKANDTMYDTMKRLTPNFKEFSKLECKVLDYAHACEKNGFINGFEACMSLFVEGDQEDVE